MNTTQLRYVLYYSDDLVCDSFKIKSRIKYTTAKNQHWDMQLLRDPEFQNKIRESGFFFQIDVSPKARHDNRSQV